VLKKGLHSWFIILCCGGSFAIAEFQGKKMLSHKSDKKYVQRKKQGKRQMNQDKSGGSMSSVGSQMRRENEVKHQENIDEIMEEYQSSINKADIIYLNAPGLNKMFFISENKSLHKLKDKIRNI
jgi:hypothetical protein